MLHEEYNAKPGKNKDGIRPTDSGAQENAIVDFLPGYETGSLALKEVLEKLRTLDALVIFEGNTVIKEEIGTIKPTSFNDEDDFGTLGGGARALAAAVATGSLGHELQQLLFVGGNPVNKERSHGGHAHSGSEIYQQTYEKYLGIIRTSKTGEDSLHGGRTLVRADTETRIPLILDTSQNSYGDIVSTLKEALERGWKTVGFLSNQYHLPRLGKLLEKAVREHPQYRNIEVHSLSAEEVILALSSEKAAHYYIKLFSAAYAAPSMQRRIEAEQRGIKQIEDGSYTPGESKPALSIDK